jgi:hypothetical protein
MIQSIINFILSLFGIDTSKKRVIQSLEDEKEALENKLEETDDEKPTDDDILDFINDK